MFIQRTNHIASYIKQPGFLCYATVLSKNPAKGSLEIRKEFATESTPKNHQGLYLEPFVFRM